MSEEKLLPWLLILPILHITSPNMNEIGTGTVTTPPVSTRLVHYTRITGALSISFMGDPNLSGDPNSSYDVQRIKRACEIVRKATLMRKDPNYPGGGASVPEATLTVVYIPYHPPPVGKVPKPNEPNCAACAGGRSLV